MLDKENLGPLVNARKFVTQSNRQHCEAVKGPFVDGGFAELYNSVERVLAKDHSGGTFSAAKEEWEALMLIMKESAELILRMEFNVKQEESKSERIVAEHHRLTTLATGSGILNRLRRSNAHESSVMGNSIEFYPKSMIFEDSPSESPPSVVARVLEEVDNVYYRYKEALIDLDLKSASVLAFLDKEINQKLKLDRFNADDVSVHPSPTSIEFSMISTPEELDSLDKTNTRKWLADVLKWQDIDIELHRRSLAHESELKKEIREKQVKIKEILRQKVQAAIDLKMLRLANKSMDAIMESTESNSNCQMTQAPSLFPVD